MGIHIIKKSLLGLCDRVGLTHVLEDWLFAKGCGSLHRDGGAFRCRASSLPYLDKLEVLFLDPSAGGRQGESLCAGWIPSSFTGEYLFQEDVSRFSPCDELVLVLGEASDRAKDS